MIQTTMKEALEMYDNDSRIQDYIYLYRDGETIFYIGKSVQPFERLQEHLGQGEDLRALPFPDAIGKLILSNRPDSFEWTVEIVSLEEIEAKHEIKLSIDDAERCLIIYYKPCLNEMYNRNPTPLPICYVKSSGIANEGIKQSQ